MEYTPGEVSGNTEEVTGRKKLRFKFLKVRLFGRLKKKETEGQMKQSQSTGDVTAQGGQRDEDDVEDNCHYPEGPKLSSRALSHDSIFLADLVQPPQPTRVLSQENVHSKIKALQLKLQKQNVRLAPPLLIPGKRIEDSGTTSEDDGLPRSPPEMSCQEYPEAKNNHSLLSLAGTGSEEEEQGGFSQPSSRPLSPVPQLFLTEAPSAGVDFTKPARYIPTLDNSAARHRMSIRPRNQRASTRIKKTPTWSSSMNNLNQSLSEKEESQQCITHLQITHQYQDSEDVEKVTQLPASPWSSLNSQIYTATELFQQNDSSSLSLDENTVLQTSRGFANEEQEATASLLPLSVCAVGILSVSKSVETTTRSHPIPPPRTKKATLSNINNVPSKVFGLKPVDTDTASSSGLAESQKEDDSLRPSSFPFNIASAKYRSRTNDENIYKQEESTGNTQKGQPYNPSQVIQMEKVENTKSAEVCRNTTSASDKRSSLLKEVLAQNVSKTVVDNSVKPEGCSHYPQYLKSNSMEEPEDRRGLFGVKLRSTSLCLKYRSELPKSEIKIKRHSVEGHLLHVSCDVEEGDNSKKVNVQSSPAPQSLDSQQDPTLHKGPETDGRPGSAWKSSSQDNARVHQSFPAKPQPAPPPNSTSLSTLQPRLQLPTSSKPQPVTQSSQQVSPRTAPRAMERWNMLHKREEKSFVKQTTQRDDLLDYKGHGPGANSNTQTEPDQQPPSDRTEPTWMELAKRKSLAWSDKSLDSVHF